MKLEYRPYKFKSGALKGYYTFAWQKQRHWIIRFLLWLASPVLYFVRRHQVRKAKQELQKQFQEIQAAQIDTMKKGLEFLESLEPYTANLSHNKPRAINPARARRRDRCQAGVVGGNSLFRKRTINHYL